MHIERVPLLGYGNPSPLPPVLLMFMGLFSDVSSSGHANLHSNGVGKPDSDGQQVRGADAAALPPGRCQEHCDNGTPPLSHPHRQEARSASSLRPPGGPCFKLPTFHPPRCVLPHGLPSPSSSLRRLHRRWRKGGRCDIRPPLRPFRSKSASP